MASPFWDRADTLPILGYDAEAQQLPVEEQDRIIGRIQDQARLLTRMSPGTLNLSTRLHARSIGNSLHDAGWQARCKQRY